MTPFELRAVIGALVLSHARRVPGPAPGKLTVSRGLIPEQGGHPPCSRRISAASPSTRGDVGARPERAPPGRPPPWRGPPRALRRRPAGDAPGPRSVSARSRRGPARQPLECPLVGDAYSAVSASGLHAWWLPGSEPNNPFAGVRHMPHQNRSTLNRRRGVIALGRSAWPRLGCCALVGSHRNSSLRAGDNRSRGAANDA
jgi:hypothetical protein